MIGRPGRRLGIALAALVWVAGIGARADYLDDARTARAVSFNCPRGSLASCLAAISRVSQVTLTVSPALASEPLVAFVPKRPLRESMLALEELFDGAWIAETGARPVYRLIPDAQRGKERNAARAELFRRFERTLDEQAAEAARDKTLLKALPETQRQQRFALTLWRCLSPAERAELLHGSPVTISIPPGRANEIYSLLLALADKPRLPLTGPLLASFDLDDPYDKALPVIRARATAPRRGSVVGAIGQIEWMRPPPPPKPKEVAEDTSGTPLPPEIGANGRFLGTRDEQLFKIGRACDLPILSRHRAYGGSANSISVGGRRISAVMADYAAGCEASAVANARGFQLVRSLTEAFDAVGTPPTAVVRRYLAARPPAGQTAALVPLAELSALTPMQLSVLERTGVCPEDAGLAREIYVNLRFIRALTPEQRRALFSDAGLAVSTLSHAQIHAVLDERRKRADWDIHQHLQDMLGLTFRFAERRGNANRGAVFQAVRAGTVVSSSTVDLPLIEPPEAGPEASL